MSVRIPTLRSKHLINIILGVIALSLLATFVDSMCHANVVGRQGVGLIAILNPIRLVRYMLSPMGLLFRAVIIFLTFVPYAIFVLGAAASPRES